MRSHTGNNTLNTTIAKRWLFSTALTAASLAAMAIPAQAQVAPTALPTGENIIVGDATYDRSTLDELHITQNEGRTVAEYLSFNIGSDASVIMHQNSNDRFIHIDKGAQVSVIDGFFSGAGTNYILNGNGVLIGKTARIDMHSFGLSTGDLDVDHFTETGAISLSNFGDGELINDGRISVSEAGLAAFVSPYITNNGVINARMGNVVLASGQTVTLDLHGDGLLEIAVDGELEDALIENYGHISAQGGTVQISAQAAKEAVDNIINMEGVIDVSSFSNVGGKIILSGGDEGTVFVSDTLDASGVDGGEIDITGQNIEIAATAQLKADGGKYEDGSEMAIYRGGSSVKGGVKGGYGTGDGGNISVVGSETAIYHGASSVEGGVEGGDGGFIEVSASHVVIDGTFKVGDGGELLIDPVDLCVFGAGGSCGSSSSVDFITSLRPVLIGGGTVTVETSDATGDDGDLTIVGNLSDGGFETTARGTWNIIANDDILFGRYGASQAATLVVSGEGLDVNSISHDNALGDDTPGWSFTVLSSNTLINTGGGNFTSNAANFRISSGAVLDAAGGNIDINNSTGIFESTDADSIRTSGLGTIEIDQNEERVGIFSTTLGSIQNVIDAINNTGTGQNTINVGAGTYKENLLIDKALKLVGAPGATLQYDAYMGTGNLITVTAADVNIDPFVFDGLNAAANGIYADGANNLVVDGNTFQGFNDKNIFINNSNNVQVLNNIISGGNTGIQLVGSNSAEIIGNTVHDITGTTRYADGIHINGGSDVLVAGNTIYDTNDEGIYVTGARGNLIVKNNDIYNVGLNSSDIGNGIELISTKGHALVKNNDVDVTEHAGILVKGSKSTASFDIINNTIENAADDGIRVSGSADVRVARNTVIDSGNDGIEISDALNAAQVVNNVVSGAQMYGVNIVNAASSVIKGNDVSGIVNAAGIYVYGSDNALIGGHGKNAGNTVHDAYTGIQLVGSNSAKIIGNTVHDITGTTRYADGIHINGGSDVLVAGNTIYDTNDEGIYVTGARGTLVVKNNDIYNVGLNSFDIGNGIELISTKGHALVKNNDVDVTEHAGILVKGSKSTASFDIINNTIENAADDGIRVSGSADVRVARNTVIDSGNDGIEISDALNAAQVVNNVVSGAQMYGVNIVNAASSVIKGNDVSGIVNAAGIYVYGSDNALIGGHGENAGNTVHDAYTGIQLVGSSSAEIIGNTVHDITGTSRYADGIHVNGGSDVLIAGNTIYDTNDEGIYVTSARGNLIVKNNDIYNVGLNTSDIGNGIELISTKGHALVKNNDVDVTEHAGILVKGSKSTASFDIINNTIENAADDGIRASGSADVRVARNTVIDSGNDGIEISDALNAAQVVNNVVIGSVNNGISVSSTKKTLIVDNSAFYKPEGEIGYKGVSIGYNPVNTRIVGNDVSYSGVNGLAVLGSGHGKVVVSGNTFIDNPTGALFESGNIDLSNLDNPNSFINTLPSPVGIRFDEVGPSGSLSLVNDTLGSTEFTGFQAPESYYVRVEDGSFLNGSIPIDINGVDATFDLVNPSSTGGVISASELNYIEERLYDADDSVINGRGQIFTGVAAQVTGSISNLEDFFYQSSPLGAAPGRFNVRILGLPTVGPARVATGAAALNAITPAAGGEGQDAEDLANLEPAAGEESAVSCWGDAIRAASSGATVSYSFGGSIEETLAGASACGSTGS